METTPHEKSSPSPRCFICKGPILSNTEKTESLQTCESCKSVYEQYDSVKITRAYSASSKSSARIVIFQKQIDKENQHCLLRIIFQSSEEFAFKSVDEALTAGKVKAQALLGDDVKFEDVKIENPTDSHEQLKLLAGIPKQPK